MVMGISDDDDDGGGGGGMDNNCDTGGFDGSITAVS